jgi:hypothetical protein
MGTLNEALRRAPALCSALPLKPSPLRDSAVTLASLGMLCWVYAPAFSIPLWGDDAWHVYTLRHPAYAIRMLYDPAVALTVNWSWFRPVGDLSHTVDYQLWGLNPFGYHLHNVILHWLTLVMLVGFLREFLSTRLGDHHAWACTAYLIPLVFVLNPVTALPVTRPSMRYDLYAALFVVSALWAFLRWETGPSTRGRGLAVGLVFAAFASKESALALLPMLLLLARGGGLRRLQAGWPFGAACIVYLIWRTLLIKGQGGYFWIDWSWHDFFHPGHYLHLGISMAALAWNLPWVLSALPLAIVLRPWLGLCTVLAFLSTLAPVIPLHKGVASTPYILYLPLLAFMLPLATGLTGLARWKWGNLVCLICILVLIWQGVQGIKPVLEREARLGEEYVQAAAAAIRLTQSQATDTTDSYFLHEDCWALAHLLALRTHTPRQAWRVLHPGAAPISAGLVKKAKTGEAQIFTYREKTWQDTTIETLQAIRARLAASQGPPPTLTAAVDGYRVGVELREQRPHEPFQRYLYIGPQEEPGIYYAVTPFFSQEVSFAIWPGTYALTAIYTSLQGWESPPAIEVRVTIPSQMLRK